MDACNSDCSSGRGCRCSKKSGEINENLHHSKFSLFMVLSLQYSYIPLSWVYGYRCATTSSLFLRGSDFARLGSLDSREKDPKGNVATTQKIAWKCSFSIKGAVNLENVSVTFRKVT